MANYPRTAIGFLAGSSICLHALHRNHHWHGDKGHTPEESVLTHLSRNGHNWINMIDAGTIILDEESIGTEEVRSLLVDLLLGQCESGICVNILPLTHDNIAKFRLI